VIYGIFLIALILVLRDFGDWGGLLLRCWCRLVLLSGRGFWW